MNLLAAIILLLLVLGTHTHSAKVSSAYTRIRNGAPRPSPEGRQLLETVSNSYDPMRFTRENRRSRRTKTGESQLGRERSRRGFGLEQGKGEEDGYTQHHSSTGFRDQQVAFTSVLSESRKRGQVFQAEQPRPYLRHEHKRCGEQYQGISRVEEGSGDSTQAGPPKAPQNLEPVMAPCEVSSRSQPTSSDQIRDPSSNSISSHAQTSFAATRSRSLQRENGSPMPHEGTTTISNAQGCLATEDGHYGSSNGDQVDVFFFYQVEASPGTTETQINGIILDDIEITLLDFMIPVFFPECGAATETTRRETGRYVGMSSKPADFVLRGFDCNDKAKEPCFVISGSMAAFTNNLDYAKVQTEMRIAIFKVMESGAIAAAISRVNGVALLDDALNLATFPVTNAPSQSTRFPTTPSPTLPPSAFPSTQTSTTVAPTTEQPTTVAPTTEQPTTVAPTTEPPTPSPSASPSTLAPSTREPTTISPTIDEPTPGSTFVIVVSEPTMTPSSYDAPTMSPTVERDTPTIEPSLSNSSNQGGGNWTETKSPAAAPTANVDSNTTLRPIQSPTQTFVIKTEEHKSAFQKVPIWVWVLLGLLICVCCTYADPDEDEDDTGVNRTIRAQERVSLANMGEHDKDRESVHDSEAFSSVEYVRRLYRQ